MHAAPYRVMVVDDHALIRQGIRALLTASDQFEIVGEAGNGRDAVQLANQLAPDLLLIDLSMPNMNGTEAIHAINSRNPDIRIIALTVHRTEEYLRAALDAGARGYLLKDDSFNELLTAVQAVIRGDTYLSPGVCNHMVNSYLDQGEGTERSERSSASWDRLTVREREVIKLIAEGNTNKMIARILHISVKTVEKHRTSLMKKLDLHSTSRITAYAIEHGLVQI